MRAKSCPPVLYVGSLAAWISGLYAEELLPHSLRSPMDISSPHPHWCHICPLSLLGGLCVLAEAYDCPHATDNSILASISSNTNIESSYEVGGQRISNRWSCINFKL